VSGETFEGARRDVLEEIRRQGMARARLHDRAAERELEAAEAAIRSGAVRASADGVTYVVV
jgi:hypothetical protein